VFRGLAQTMGFGSYVAACAEVSGQQKGALKVHRIVAATDPGHAVNPQQIAAQVEGSSSTACRRRCSANARSRTAASSRATSTPTR
jgi:CO/xanthine dehydrogenase Mo-binding subunit